MDRAFEFGDSLRRDRLLYFAFLPLVIIEIQ